MAERAVQMRTRPHGAISIVGVIITFYTRAWMWKGHTVSGHTVAPERETRSRGQRHVRHTDGSSAEEPGWLWQPHPFLPRRHDKAIF